MIRSDINTHYVILSMSVPFIMSYIIPNLAEYAELSDKDKLLLLEELYVYHEKTVEEMKSAIQSMMPLLQIDHPDFEKVTRRVLLLLKQPVKSSA